jgi:hypothetical protein
MIHDDAMQSSLIMHTIFCEMKNNCLGPEFLDHHTEFLYDEIAVSRISGIYTKTLFVEKYRV